LLQNPGLLQNPQMMQMMMNMFAQQKNNTPQPEPTTQPQQPTYTPPKQETYTPKQETAQPPTQKKEESKVELTDFDKLKQQADDAYKVRKFDEAIELYNKCIEQNDKHLIPRNNKAACYIEKKEFDTALEVIDEAIKVYQETDFSTRNASDFAKVLARKARIYHLKGELDKAIEMYSDSLLEDKNPRVESALKELKRDKKKQEELAYLNPEIADQHREKGNDLYTKNEFALAVNEYEEAVRRNPNDKRIYNNLAACFMKMLKFNEALKNVEKALSFDQGFVKAWLRKAQIHIFTKEYHKAVECYEKVLKIEPENQEAAQGLQTTNMKIATSMQGQNDEERQRRAMADPEIQAIMIDPMVRIALEHMQSSPQKAMEYFQDPTLAPKLNKLIQAGIIKLG